MNEQRADPAATSVLLNTAVVAELGIKVCLCIVC